MRLITVALAATILAAPAVHADDSLTDAIKTGRANLDLRYRLEDVDQAGLPKDATASTLRTRLGYTTGNYHDVYASLEFADLRVIGNTLYNDTANGKTDRPVVADPADTELDQAFLGYRPGADTELRLGRQRITLDDQRFIGNVGFRQLEQTYDALGVHHAGADVDLYYAYLGQANRIFGAHHPDPLRANLDLDAHILHGAWRWQPLTLTAYGYLLANQDQPAASHKDLGLRAAGAVQGDTWTFGYTLEAARQSAYRDGTSAAFGDSYRLLEASLKRDALGFRLGMEVLGGDGSHAFQTPFATLHAFDGWADRFLTTPVDGLVDTYAGADGQWHGVMLTAVYHDFKADHGSADYGHEMDIKIAHKFGPVLGQIEYADYIADRFATDTRILWLTAQFGF